MGKKRQPGTASKAAQQLPSSTADSSPCTTWAEASKLSESLFENINPGHLLKGSDSSKARHIVSQLETLASSLQQVAASCPAASADHLDVCICSIHLEVLLADLLAARKRSRDWKQAAYCSGVIAVLQAHATVLEVAADNGWQPTPGQQQDIRGSLAAAMQELTQLLGQPAVEQSQQQHQQQSQPAAQQQQQLMLLGSALLQWCLAGDALAVVTSFNGADLQLRAVALASALAARMPALPTMPPGGCTKDAQPHTSLQTVAKAVLQVMDRVYAAQLDLLSQHPRHAGVLCIDLSTSPAMLQMTMGMLLLLSLFLDNRGSTTSTASSRVGSDSTSSHGGSSSSSVSSSSHDGAVGATAHQELRGAQGMPAGFSQLWLAAGFAPGAWDSWLEAARVTWQSDVLQDTAFAAGERHAAAARTPQGVFDGTLAGTICDFKTLPDGVNPPLQAFAVLTQVLTKCITCSIFVEPQIWMLQEGNYSSNLSNLKHSDDLGRLQRQVLQAAVGPLPGFLLHMAAQHGKGLPLVTELAAAAAWCCCTAWQAPGLRLAATAAAAAGGERSGNGSNRGDLSSAAAGVQGEGQSAGALLQGVLGGWLTLMQQQLLQEPGGLLHHPMAVNAASSSTSTSRSSSSSASTAVSGCALPKCSCYSSRSLPGWDRQHGYCGRMFCMAMLLSVLQPLSYACDDAGSIAVWRDKMPAVLLLLEVVARHLLPQRQSWCSTAGGTCMQRSSGASWLSDQLQMSLAELASHPAPHRPAPLQQLLLGGLAPSFAGRDLKSSEAKTEQLCELHLQPALAAVHCTAGPEAAMLGGSDQQQLQQGRAGPGHEALLQQLCCVVASYVKACTHTPTTVARSCSAVLPRMLELVSDAVLLQALSMQDRGASLAEVRAVLAPVVALYGAYMQQLGAAVLLLQQELQALPAAAALEEEQGAGRQQDAAGGQPYVRVRLAGAVSNCNEAVQGVSYALKQFRDGVLQVWGGTAAQQAAGSDDGGISSSSSGATSRGSKLLSLSVASSQVGTGSAEVSDTSTTVDQRQQHQQDPSAAQQAAAAAGFDGPAYQADLSEQLQDISSGGALHAAFATFEGLAAAASPRNNIIHDLRPAARGAGLALKQPGVQALIDGGAAFAALAERLQAVGVALFAQVPMPWWCNNQGSAGRCQNMAGVSEAQLVGGKDCVCGGCKTARYCSRACQVEHWKQHKAVCAQLGAARAARAAAAVGEAAAPKPE